MSDKDDNIIMPEADIPPPPPPPISQQQEKDSPLLKSVSPKQSASSLLSTPIINQPHTLLHNTELSVEGGTGTGTISTTELSARDLTLTPSADTTINSSTNNPPTNNTIAQQQQQQQSAQQQSSILSPPLLLSISDNSPAAEALRANADVRVSKLHKLGRSTKLQAGVRVLKSSVKLASGQAPHYSDKRGAPPFVSPRNQGVNNSNVNSPGDTSLLKSLSATLAIPEVDDEIDQQQFVGSDSSEQQLYVHNKQLSERDGNESSIGSADNNVNDILQRKRSESLEEKILAAAIPSTSKDELSINILDDSNNSDNRPFGEQIPITSALQQQKQQQQEIRETPDRSSTSRHTRTSSLSHITHAANCSAVAAACRAGEEFDRRRVTVSNDVDLSANIPPPPPPPNNSTYSSFRRSSPASSTLRPKLGASFKDSPFSTSLATLFNKSSDKQSVGEENDTNASKDDNNKVIMPEMNIFRRSSMSKLHQMPSEISVAETTRHANIRQLSSGSANAGGAVASGGGGDVASQRSSVLSDDIVDNISDVMLPSAATVMSKEVEEGMVDVDTSAAAAASKVKRVEVNPIVVEIPGSRIQEGGEETKDEEEERLLLSSENTDIAVDQEKRDHERKAMLAKAKKSLSRRATKKKLQDTDDDDAFHFHGPKQVRKWVRKRRTKEESKNQRSYVKGKVIDGKHELYTMSIAVMFGMRTSIGRTNLAMSQTAHNERRWLDNDDLMAVEKYEFPPRGSDITPPHQLNHTFKFKDYSPLAFAYLRRMFGVNEYDFLLSVCGNANYIEFQSNAKSGQFFFYSPDGKYMIKTMTNTESKFLRRILPHYFRHCAKHPNTLITKFLGMYRVKLYHLKRNVKFVVMKSVYDTDKYLNQLFDVKGSTTGRDANPGDAVKKDNDIRRTLPDGAFVLEPGLQSRLRTQVEHDCQWLKSMKIMDYSMLIGVHNIAHRNTKTALKSTTLQPTRVQSNDDEDIQDNSSYDASNATLDKFLDVDDDDSYLDGTHQKGKSLLEYGVTTQSDDASNTRPTIRVFASSNLHDYADDESSKDGHHTKKTDAMVEKAIEDMYWPFHRFYDIQGLRRMNPIRESLLVPQPKKKEEGQTDEPKEEESTSSKLRDLFTFGHQAPMTSGGTCDLPTFEKPLSYRKDAGFMMDTSAMDLPIKMSVPGAPHMAEYCDGKIFYMGIIDILQQFNIRKRGEARYRRLSGKGWEAASCVHPNLYADRFVRFFDEYTECRSPPTITEENAEEIELEEASSLASPGKDNNFSSYEMKSIISDTNIEGKAEKPMKTENKSD